jgi:hypothetical protein
MGQKEMVAPLASVHAGASSDDATVGEASVPLAAFPHATAHAQRKIAIGVELRSPMEILRCSDAVGHAA